MKILWRCLALYMLCLGSCGFAPLSAPAAEPFLTLDKHSKLVRAVLFTPDGKTLVSGSVDGTIRFWNPADGSNIRTLQEGATHLAFSPDGNLLASDGRDLDNDAKVVGVPLLWDVKQGKVIARLYGHTHKDAIGPVVFSPDGTKLASGGEKTIKLWDVASGKNIDTFQTKDAYWSLTFSPDGTMLAASGGKAPELWDVKTRQKIGTLPKGHLGGLIQSVAFSPNGKTLASAGGDPYIVISDVNERKIVALLDETRQINCVVFSPDGKLLATGSSENRIRLFDLVLNKEIATLQGKGRDEVYSLAFSPDGKLLASGSGDKTVKVWKVADILKERK